MAKTVFVFKGECFASNANKQGSNIVIAQQVQQTEKGPTARAAVSILNPDKTLSGKFAPEKKYTVTITED